MCIRDRWKDGTKQSILLPEVAIEDFDACLGWLYRGELITKQPVKRFGRKDSQLVRIWIMADELGDLQLRNAVIDKFIERFKTDWHYPDYPEIELIWEKTAPGSTLRKLVLHSYMSLPCPNYMKEHHAKFHPDFMAELTATLLEKTCDGGRKLRHPWEIGACAFHEHNERSPRCTQADSSPDGRKAWSAQRRIQVACSLGLVIL